MCHWLQRRRSSWPLRQLGVPFDPKGVPLASEGSWDPKMVTWLPKYVICKVMTFIEGFMEAELMVTSTTIDDNQPTDRVNIRQSALEDGMAEFCN